MKTTLRFAVLVLFSLCFAPSGLSQVKPPAKAGKAAPSKLTDIAPPVRDEIDRLMSGEAGKRASGAASLAEMGGRSASRNPVSDKRSLGRQVSVWTLFLGG